MIAEEGIFHVDQACKIYVFIFCRIEQLRQSLSIVLVKGIKDKPY